MPSVLPPPDASSLVGFHRPAVDGFGGILSGAMQPSTILQDPILHTSPVQGFGAMLGGVMPSTADPV
jgi:hypothetical protein